MFFTFRRLADTCLAILLKSGAVQRLAPLSRWVSACLQQPGPSSLGAGLTVNYASGFSPTLVRHQQRLHLGGPLSDVGRERTPLY